MLGVPRDATTAEIRRAWLEQARRLHPDAGGDDEAAMRQVNEAWRVLGDPARRLAHDRDLGIDHGPRRSPPPPARDTDERAVPVADQVDAPRATRAGDLVVLVPPALLAAGVGSVVVAAMLVNTALLGAGFALLALSAVSFVIAPFLALARDRRRDRRQRRAP